MNYYLQNFWVESALAPAVAGSMEALLIIYALILITVLI